MRKGEVEKESKEPRPLGSQDQYGNLFTKKFLTFILGLYLGLPVLREPVTLMAGTVNHTEKSAALGKRSGTLKKDTPHASTSENEARPVTAQMSYLQAEQNWTSVSLVFGLAFGPTNPQLLSSQQMAMGQTENKHKNPEPNRMTQPCFPSNKEKMDQKGLKHINRACLPE